MIFLSEKNLFQIKMYTIDANGSKMPLGPMVSFPGMYPSTNVGKENFDIAPSSSNWFWWLLAVAISVVIILMILKARRRPRAGFGFRFY